MKKKMPMCSWKCLVIQRRPLNGSGDGISLLSCSAGGWLVWSEEMSTCLRWRDSSSGLTGRNTSSSWASPSVGRRTKETTDVSSPTDSETENTSSNCLYQVSADCLHFNFNCLFTVCLLTSGSFQKKGPPQREVSSELAFLLTCFAFYLTTNLELDTK